ncbi:hypothetical protein E2C01_058200 [Portunus trituberculatus]|uniref:Uncharacterized protein n=1 Tax=Portunus trituberculatus TaxID=210409 RepID=A0A5B7H4M9_PORTR|nr:hypothetical protein [Portunus trituberculatus]
MIVRLASPRGAARRLAGKLIIPRPPVRAVRAVRDPTSAMHQGFIGYARAAGGRRPPAWCFRTTRLPAEWTNSTRRKEVSSPGTFGVSGGP